MSTILRKRRTSRMSIGPYRRHELLTGEVKIVVQGYSGYGNGIGTVLTAFISDEMRQDWANHRDALIAFWKSGKSSSIFPDNLPWLFIAHGSPNKLTWAEKFLDGKKERPHSGGEAVRP